MNNLLTVVPPQGKPGCPTITMGTKVLGPDGVAIGGISRIELIGVANDVWRARIYCLVHAPTIENVIATINRGDPLRWWQRALIWLAGVRAVDVTTLEDEHHARWAKP